METNVHTISQSARYLGLAGLLPQIIACLYAFNSSEWQWVALAVGFGYAAFIFSFLGGVWWGLALGKHDAPTWIYAAAITPSLIALASFIPWTLGWEWPGPSMMLLGACLLLSPLVDKAIGKVIALPAQWIQLRWQLSLGLGVLTLLLSALPLPGGAT